MTWKLLQDRDDLYTFLANGRSFTSAGNQRYSDLWYESDKATVWLLEHDIDLNSASLSSLEAYDGSWNCLISVQRDQDKHLDALDYCQVLPRTRQYYTNDYDGFNIALLCNDYPEKMRDYFLQWE